MPGWKGDADTIPHRYLFPEEALRARSSLSPTAFDPFGPPEGSSGASLFSDNLFDARSSLGPNPTPDDIAAVNQWLAFSRWMLGAPFRGEPPATEFDKYLADLMRAVRIRNAKLYFMRRLHLAETSGGAADYEQYPPNPHNSIGQQPEPPHVDGTNYDQWVDDAQKEWDEAAKKLDALVDPKTPGFPYSFAEVIVEMVEVNGYIMSLRVVASPPASPPTGSFESLEVGGSSSSHVRISSGFSSPSP